MKVLALRRERVGKKRLQSWKTESWILHHHNAPAHNVLPMKRYLANKGTLVFKHTPYSPNLVPCDFLLSLKIKSALKGSQFVSMEEVKRKLAELLSGLTRLSALLWLIISIHAFIIIFFITIPIIIGRFRNWLIPLIIYSNDLIYPRLNNFRFWILIPSLIFIIFRIFFNNKIFLTNGKNTFKF